MSEETNRTPDISRVISTLMENPDIIERISALMNSEPQPKQESVSEAVEKADAATYTAPENERKRRRSQLLGAIKPYVKKERREAIDSVIAIADIVDMMRRK